IGDQPVVTASSTYTGDPQDQPRSAFDGDTATAWIASPADPHPRLTISWGYPRVVSRITIQRPPGASGLAQVLITGSAGQLRGAMTGTDGVVSFAPMKTASLTLTFTTDQAPVQISDVLIPGVRAIRTPAVLFRLPCGLGPRLAVDGQTVPTGVTGTFADLLDGRPLRFTACLAVPLTAGTSRVTESATDPYDVRDVVVKTAGLGTPAAAPTAATVLSWTSSVRKLRVAAATRSYLEVNENFNAGWRAVLGGRELQPVRLDGWKQAWVLPAGTSGVVTLTYRPESLYRVALIGGLAALVLIIAVALAVPVWRRRARQPLAWPADPGPRRLWPDRPWRRWLAAGAIGACLAAAGLVLGGYPGALAVPAVVAVLCIPSRGRRAASDPRLIGGLFAVALAVGAIGEHLVLSGHSGPFVTAAANTIPQAICLVVVSCLAAALLCGAVERGAVEPAGGPE
ncbi:MAG TPA: discoidin domain-containing protein, partial [Trebonia sp.]|nr:discoidin domain-containing protein [Trebonia sp.]